jgi:hypothetical protein
VNLSRLGGRHLEILSVVLEDLPVRSVHVDPELPADADIALHIGVTGVAGSDELPE